MIFFIYKMHLFYGNYPNAGFPYWLNNNYSYNTSRNNGQMYYYNSNIMIISLITFIILTIFILYFYNRFSKKSDESL